MGNPYESRKSRLVEPLCMCVHNMLHRKTSNRGREENESGRGITDEGPSPGKEKKRKTDSKAYRGYENRRGARQPPFLPPPRVQYNIIYT